MENTGPGADSLKRKKKTDDDERMMKRQQQQHRFLLLVVHLLFPIITISIPLFYSSRFLGRFPVEGVTAAATRATPSAFWKPLVSSSSSSSFLRLLQSEEKQQWKSFSRSNENRVEGGVSFFRSFATKRMMMSSSSSLQQQQSSQNQTTAATGSNQTIEQQQQQLQLQKPFFPIYYNDVYEVQLPPNHRFPMEKYGKVRRRVQQAILKTIEVDKNEQQEQEELVECEFRVSPLVSLDDLVLTHDANYVQRYLSGQQTPPEVRNVGFPWSEQGVNRSLSSTGGTVAAAIAAVEEWQRSSLSRLCWSAHVAGGTHHAFKDRGEGFCVFSDIAVAANVVLKQFPNSVKRILILDLDVHQGNGNAVLFQDNPNVFTFSMHCSANYFSKQETSDLDIELPPGCTDETYLLTLNHWLSRIQKEAQAQAQQPFDLIFFQAGVDVLEEDRLGRFSLTQRGVERRNELVFRFAAHQLKVPLVITMGGGYPRQAQQRKKKDGDTDNENDDDDDDGWAPILQAHANVYIQAHQFLARAAAAATTETQQPTFRGKS